MCERSANYYTSQLHANPNAADAQFATYQNTAVSGSLIHCASNSVAPYTFNLLNAVNGSVTLQADGSFTFIPTKDFSGIGSFDYNVTDVRGGISKSATVTITINSAVVAQNIMLETIQNKNVIFNLNALASGGMPDYSFDLVQNSAANCTVKMIGSGKLRILPAKDFSGIASFQFTATDSNGYQSTPATVSLLVHEAPSAQDLAFNGYQNTAVEGSLLDAVSQGLVPYQFASFGSPLNGSVAISDDGRFSFLPAQDYCGNANFQYTATDARGAISNSAQVAITLNALPSSGNLSYTGYTDNALYADLANAQTITGGYPPYTFAQVGSAANGSVALASDGSFLFTPEAHLVGLGGFDYLITDSNNAVSAVAHVSIGFHNPVVAQNSSATIEQDTPYTSTLASLVSGGIPPYHYLVLGDALNGSVTIDSNGNFNFIPTSGFFGDAGFIYQAIDALNGSQAQGNVSILVNQVVPQEPVIQEIAQQIAAQEVVTHDSADQHAPSIATSVVNEIPAESSVIDSVQTEAPVVQNSAPLIVTNGSFEVMQNDRIVLPLTQLVSGGVPPYSYEYVDCTLGNAKVVNSGYCIFKSAVAGNAQITIRIKDSNNTLSDPLLVNVKVNRDPSLEEVILQDVMPLVEKQEVMPSLPQAQSVQIATQMNIPISGSLINNVSNAMAPFSFSPIGAAVNGSVVLHLDGSFNFTPAPDFAGNGSFEYQITDAKGALSNLASVTVMVYGPVQEIVHQQIATQEVATQEVAPLISASSDENQVPTESLPAIDAVQTEAPVVQNSAPLIVTNGSFEVMQNDRIVLPLTQLVSGGVPPYSYEYVDCTLGNAKVVNSGYCIFKSAVAGNAQVTIRIKDSNNAISDPLILQIAVTPAPVIEAVEVASNPDVVQENIVQEIAQQEVVIQPVATQDTAEQGIAVQEVAAQEVAVQDVIQKPEQEITPTIAEMPSLIQEMIAVQPVHGNSMIDVNNEVRSIGAKKNKNKSSRKLDFVNSYPSTQPSPEASAGTQAPPKGGPLVPSKVEGTGRTEGKYSLPLVVTLRQAQDERVLRSW